MKKRIILLVALAITANPLLVKKAQAEENVFRSRLATLPDQATQGRLVKECVGGVSAAGLLAVIGYYGLKRSQITSRGAIGIALGFTGISGACYYIRDSRLNADNEVAQTRRMLVGQFGPIADDVIYDMIGGNLTLEEAVDANVADLRMRGDMKTAFLIGLFPASDEVINDIISNKMTLDEALEANIADLNERAETKAAIAELLGMEAR